MRANEIKEAKEKEETELNSTDRQIRQVLQTMRALTGPERRTTTGPPVSLKNVSNWRNVVRPADGKENQQPRETGMPVDDRNRLEHQLVLEDIEELADNETRTLERMEKEYAETLDEVKKIIQDAQHRQEEMLKKFLAKLQASLEKILLRPVVYPPPPFPYPSPFPPPPPPPPPPPSSSLSSQ